MCTNRFDLFVLFLIERGIWAAQMVYSMFSLCGFRACKGVNKCVPSASGFILLRSRWIWTGQFVRSFFFFSCVHIQGGVNIVHRPLPNLFVVFQKVDLDGTGDISFEEFVVLMRVGGMETDYEKEINGAFSFFDKNGDGQVFQRTAGRVYYRGCAYHHSASARYVDSNPVRGRQVAVAVQHGTATIDLCVLFCVFAYFCNSSFGDAITRVQNGFPARLFVLFSVF